MVERTNNPHPDNSGRTPESVIEVPVLTWRAVLFAIALAFILGYILVRLDYVWTWPMAAAIVAAAWWVYGQHETYKVDNE